MKRKQKQPKIEAVYWMDPFHLVEEWGPGDPLEDGMPVVTIGIIAEETEKVVRVCMEEVSPGRYRGTTTIDKRLIVKRRPLRFSHR